MTVKCFQARHPARLAQASIRGLPLPIHIAQLLAFDQQQSPQDVEDAFMLPAAHRAVDVHPPAELGGQVVPLTARAHPVDHRVHGHALVDPGPADFGRRVVDG